jgi:hypothetical protein
MPVIFGYGSCATLTVSDCTANYRPVLSSERAPYMKKKESVKQRKLNSGHGPQRGPRTKTNWLTTIKLELETELEVRHSISY